jgi:hypothetical protein
MELGFPFSSLWLNMYMSWLGSAFLFIEAKKASSSGFLRDLVSEVCADDLQIQHPYFLLKYARVGNRPWVLAVAHFKWSSGPKPEGIKTWEGRSILNLILAKESKLTCLKAGAPLTPILSYSLIAIRVTFSSSINRFFPSSVGFSSLYFNAKSKANMSLCFVISTIRDMASFILK